MTEQAINITIQGMHCAVCSARVEKTVGNMPEVASVTVSLATNTARVVLAPQANPEKNLPIILEAIANMGYSAEKTAPDTAGSLTDATAMFARRHADLVKDLAARKRNVTFTFFFAVPLLYVSMAQMWAWLPLPRQISPAYYPFYYALVQLFLTLPVLWAGKSFYLNGIPALFRKTPNMDTLVALGTGAAFLYSLWQTYLLAGTGQMEQGISVSVGTPSREGIVIGALAATGIDALASAASAVGLDGVHDYLAGTPNPLHHMELYYESTAMVIALVGLGKFLEARSRMRTGEAMKALLDLAPRMATVLQAPPGIQGPYSTWKQTDVPLERVHTGDILLVRPGSGVPVDGDVLDGKSFVDESMLTGESMPIEKAEGDTLTGGTMNQLGTLVMRARHIGADTVLARIIRLVQEAQGSKAEIAGLADTISLYFVPVVMAVAVCSGLFWLLHGEGHAFALRIFVSVLIIACPCAMGLATPMSIMVASGRGAQLGMLFKNGQALENTSRINTVVFDKTGTLTVGKPELTDIVPLPLPEATSGYSTDTLLGLAASLESGSEHPLGRAIVQAAGKKSINLSPVEKFSAFPGKGAEGCVVTEEETLDIAIGNSRFALERMKALSNASTEASFPPSLVQQLESFAQEGKIPVILLAGKTPVCLFAIADPVRPEAAETVAGLRRRGIATVMLTGDNPITAQAVAQKTGITRVVAQVLPDGKEAVIAQLQQQGAVVGMVGDGVNDAPALARADVGFAMSSGIDIAVETGDVILMRNGIAAIGTALALGRATVRNIRQNLFWAFAYNIIGIPFAAGIFTLFGGPALSPMLAGAAMAMSSVCVVTNSLRLRFFTGRGE